MSVYKITEIQLKDYIRCPIFYRIKYDNNRISVDDPLSMNKLLNQIATGFCVSLMDGIVISPDKLKRKWDMLINRYPDYINSVRARDGLGKLYQFYRWAEVNQLRIADIGSEYIIPIDDENGNRIEYHGSLGIISANINNDPENLIIDFSNRYPDQADLDLQLKTTLDHIGFQLLYKCKLAGTRVHNVKGDRDFFTTRDNAMLLGKVKTIIKNVVTALKQNIWYPNESPLCQSCTVRDFCLGYGIK